MKPTVIVEEAPGASVMGVVIPDSENELPASDAEETIKFAVPVFLIVRDCVSATPTETFPKLILAGVTEICG